MSTPTNCPKCGADIKAAPGATQYQCPYCQQLIQLAAPPPPPAQSFGQGGFQQGGIPQIVVIQRSAPSPVIYSGGVGSGAMAQWIIWVVVVVVLSLFGAGGWGFRRWHHGFGSGIGMGTWDGTVPLSCAGNDSIDATGVTASFSAGTAIAATGNCTVTCTNCTLRAPVAVQALGNGDVKLINCNVTGTVSALSALGNGSVEALGNTTVNGPIHQGGNGHVTGVNTSAPPAAAAPPPVAHPAAQPVHPQAPAPPLPPGRRPGH